MPLPASPPTHNTQPSLTSNSIYILVSCFLPWKGPFEDEEGNTCLTTSQPLLGPWGHTGKRQKEEARKEWRKEGKRVDRILFSPSQTKTPTRTWCRSRKESFEAPLRRHPLGANGWRLRIPRGFPRPPWGEVASSLQHSFDRDLPLSPPRHKERNCLKQI